MEEMQICKENSKKKPLESPPLRPTPPTPSSPSPTSSPPPPSSPSLIEIYEEDYETARSRCAADELHVEFVIPLARLVRKRIIGHENMMRTEKSYKESWDIGVTSPISHREMLCPIATPSERDEAKRYLRSAAATNYFDVPHPNDRPVDMDQGFYVIYPENQRQEDPIFVLQPNFKKYLDSIPKLGLVAVEYHNFITGSDLSFREMLKTNMFFDGLRHHYYINLIATDKSGKTFKCQSRVICVVRHYEITIDIGKDVVPIGTTIVESFRRVEYSH